MRPAGGLNSSLWPTPVGLVGIGLMGLAMGLTAMALIYSPWGRRSGAHLNPAGTVPTLLEENGLVIAACSLDGSRGL